jgi:hypothetical protein
MKHKILIFMVIVLAAGFLAGCSPRQITTDGYGTKADKWILPRNDGHMPLWGIKGGIVVGIHPGRLSWSDDNGGPRGLFRLGYENAGALRFVNFMAVNPVTRSGGNLRPNGSEMMKSPSDGKAGIKFYPYPADYLNHPDRYDKRPSADLAAEVLFRNGRQILTWGIKTEKFPNGTVCFFVMSIDEKKPTEVRIVSYVLKGKSNVESLILSATFGNITRLRKAYMKKETIHTEDLFPKDYGRGFSPVELFGPHEIPKDRRGDLVFAVGPDEKRPWETAPYPHPTKLLQYYRKPQGSWTGDIRALLNARTKFWNSFKKIPGGNSYENIGIVEPFKNGQAFSYGFYKGTVSDLLDGRPSKRF